MKLSVLSAAALVGLPGLAAAQVVAGDDFSYVDALTNQGWVAHSGAGNKIVMADGSVATLEQSSGSGEDVSLTFAAFGATDTIFASFDVELPSGNPVNPDGQGLYFAHFKDATFAFRGRTGVLSPAGGGDYALAIHADNADLGAGTAWPNDLSFDTTYKVVISWNAATGMSELWVDPTTDTDPSVTHTGTFTGALMEAFALRQSNDYTGFMHVDNVVVGHTFADVCPPAGVDGTQTPRAGSPPNPGMLLPGNPPNIGTTWNPTVSAAGIADILILSTLPGINVPTAFGTLLCNIPGPAFILVGPSGVPFAVPIPNDPAIIGLPVCTQGSGFAPGLVLTLTNALDLVLGG